jgi:hypothetical protein
LAARFGYAQRKRLLMRLARDLGAAAARQKIEIGAGICLHDSLHVKLLIAAFHWIRRGLPPRTPAIEFVRRHVKMKTSHIDIQFYKITILHEGKIAAHRRLGTNVEHDRAVRGSAHARI